MKEKIIILLRLNAEKTEGRSTFWNMTFCILSALQSSIMVMAVTRVSGAETAGIVSIAFATAYLMYTLGTYGVRNFHTTDSQNKYLYNDYRRLRILSCGLMAIGSLIYCLGKNYSGYKFIVVLLICLLKMVEVIEDLYHGEFQRSGRLDIAGQLGTLRLIGSYIIFFALLFITQSLIVSIAFVIVFSSMVAILTRYILTNFIAEKGILNGLNSIRELSTSCFPLFVMSFFSIYISNAPKYAIDIFLSESDQAYYAIISMPVFTINLLSGIIYRPKLLHMAELWNAGDSARFIKLILKEICVILAFSGMVISFGLTVGLKMLEIIYGVSLVTLKTDFFILLLGGGAVACYNFLTVCLTIMRKQVFVLAISACVMLAAWAISNPIVQYAGLTGASLLYLILMTAEMLAISIVLCINLFRGRRQNAYTK